MALPERAPWWRRRNAVLVALMALVGLIAIAWVALVLAFPPARLRSIVQRQLGASLTREVRFEEASIGLWPPVRLTVHGFAIAEPRGFTQGAALRAEALHLDLDAFSLLRRSLIVRRLAVERPALHLVLRADGSTNLDSLGRGERARPARTMDFSLDRIEIHDAAVLVDDIAARRRIAFGLDTRSRYAMTRGGAVRTAGESRLTRLRIGPLAAVRDAELNSALSQLEWKIVHAGAFDPDTRRIVIERLAVAFGRTELGLSGMIDGGRAHPQFDLKTSGHAVNMGDILDYVSSADSRLLSGIRGSGWLDYDLGIHGEFAGRARPAVVGTVSVRDAAFSYPGAPAGVERLSLNARFAPDSVHVSNLVARVAGQPVRGTLSMWHLDDPLVRFRLAGDFDLQATSRLIAPPDTKLGGHLALDVAGAGRAKDPGALALSGWAQLRDGTVASPRLPKRVERMRGRFTFSSARATLEGFAAEAGKSSFTLNASVVRPLALLAKAPKPGEPRVAPAEIDFTMRSPYLDLAELVAPTPGGPLLPNARGRGRVSIARFKQGRLDVANVEAQVELEPAAVQATSFRFSGYGGWVGGQARFDLADPTQPRIRITGRVDSTRAEQLLATWTGAGKHLHGSLTSTFDLATDGISAEAVRRSLTAKGIADVTNGTLGPAPLFRAIAAFTRVPSYEEVRYRDFTVPFRVENGQVATGPAKLIGTYGEWLISGTTGFDGSLDYAVSITVPPELVGRLGVTGALAAGALADERGRVLLDLRVTGSAKSPRVSWDMKAMRDRLLGRKPLALLEPVLGSRVPGLDTLGSVRKAAADSARAEARRLQRALEDSLKKAARDALKKLFGRTKRDTARTDSVKG